MRLTTIYISLILVLIATTLNSFSQEYPLPVGDPISKKSSSENQKEVFKELTPEFLDSINIAEVSVENHLGYCDSALAVVFNHKQHGRVITSNKGPGCPIKFTPKQQAKTVEIKFTGCAGKYKLVGYDAAKNSIVESTTTITLWGTGRISIEAEEPTIAFVTLGRGTGCSTYVQRIEFK